MACEWFRDASGKVVGIMCGVRRAKRHACCVSGCTTNATIQCDWKTSRDRRRTCSAWVCEAHALHVGDNKDLCPDHAALWSTHPANPANAPQFDFSTEGEAHGDAHPDHAR